MNNKEIFADNLNRYMEQLGRSRRDISEAIGVSYYTVTDWVKGRKFPRIETLEALADYFGIRMADLIEEKETPSETHSESGDMIMGDVIKALRINQKLSLMECSEEIGIPLSDLMQYEEGSKQLPASIINAIAHFFGLEPVNITDRLLYAEPDDEVKLSFRRVYVNRFREWNKEFGLDSFTEEEVDQLFQFARFLRWQMKNK